MDSTKDETVESTATEKAQPEEQAVEESKDSTDS